MRRTILLYGELCEIHTDHQSLRYIFTQTSSFGITLMLIHKVMSELMLI
jgi:hypothetical protein